jgi:hypothetical protein
MKDLRAGPGAVLVALAMVVIGVALVLVLGDVKVDSRGEVVLGAFTAISTVVSAYVGYQVGGAGKEKAEQDKDDAKDDLAKLAGQLDKSDFEAIRPQLKTM